MKELGADIADALHLIRPLDDSQAFYEWRQCCMDIGESIKNNVDRRFDVDRFYCSCRRGCPKDKRRSRHLKGEKQ